MTTTQALSIVLGVQELEQLEFLRERNKVLNNRLKEKNDTVSKKPMSSTERQTAEEKKKVDTLNMPELYVMMLRLSLLEKIIPQKLQV